MSLDFQDIIKEIENKIGKEQWVYLYKQIETSIQDYTLYSTLIPNNKIDSVLENDNWEIHLGEGLPGVGRHAPLFEDQYLRFGNFENIEPLVYLRFFNGVEKPIVELSQELIHYFDLFPNYKDNKYTEIMGDGNEVDVIIFDENSVKIRLKHLKIYLAIKKSHLIIFLDIWRYSDISCDKLGIKEGLKTIKKQNYRYSYDIKDYVVQFGKPDMISSSWFLGKILIAGKTDFKPNLFSNSEEDLYEDYIIGIDENGDDIQKTCNSMKLGPNEFLSLVFFDRTVLSKYYNNPQKYEVIDCLISYKSFWMLPIDNNKKDYIVVFLGDLGKHLSYKEQTYWKGFNVVPDGKLSKTYWDRSFMMTNSPPQMPDLYFKHIFLKFSKSWEKKYGWELFKPLNEPDSHYFSTLHVPLSDSPIEFEQQVLSLTKILIDSMNEKEVIKGIIEQNDEWKGIDKFEAFLNEKTSFGGSVQIKFLRNLQSLRSQSVAHRKSRDYEKNIKKLDFLDFEEKGYIDNYIDILLQAIKLIQFLQICFI